MFAHVVNDFGCIVFKLFVFQIEEFHFLGHVLSVGVSFVALYFFSFFPIFPSLPLFCLIFRLFLFLVLFSFSSSPLSYFPSLLARMPSTIFMAYNFESGIIGRFPNIFWKDWFYSFFHKHSYLAHTLKYIHNINYIFVCTYT